MTSTRGDDLDPNAVADADVVVGGVNIDERRRH
jgi:hypothetical protein